MHFLCENSSRYKEERWPNISLPGFLITSPSHKYNLLHLQSLNSHDQFLRRFIHQNIFNVTEGSTVQEDVLLSPTNCERKDVCGSCWFARYNRYPVHSLKVIYFSSDQFINLVVFSVFLKQKKYHCLHCVHFRPALCSKILSWGYFILSVYIKSFEIKEKQFYTVVINFKFLKAFLDL